MSRRNSGRAGVTVIGGGSWGTTLALVSIRAGNPTTLYVRNQGDASLMRRERHHPRSLAGVELPSGLEITSDFNGALGGSDIVVIAIPTQKLRSGIDAIQPRLQGQILVSAAKGIEVGTLLRPSEIIREGLGDEDRTQVCALSGPNLAGEIAAGKPATAVVASHEGRTARAVQQALMGDVFRIYTSDDVIGVELGGALKNIIAIGAGIGDGLGAGDNAKAAFLTRGIAEMSRLGVSCGAQPLTFAGLSGIGDLIATCASPLSRNHQVGAGLAEGKSLEEVLGGMSEVAEGVETTRAAIEMARERGIELPIAENLARVMFDGMSPVEAIRALMHREPRSEDVDLG